MINDSFIGSKVPDFSIKATSGQDFQISDYLGKTIIFFFYPKDNTPVCTSEAKAFQKHYERFVKLDAVVFGISRDNLASHERFKLRLGLPFELIADTTEELCNYFDVIKMKNFFGKKIRGIVRSTFLIDKNGVIQKAWRKIQVTSHIEEVLKGITS